MLTQTKCNSVQSRAVGVSEPIFVVGSPRSGTGLLRSVLRAHPEVFGIQNETAYLVALLRRFGRSIEDVPAAVERMTSHKKFPVQEIPVERVREEFAGDTEIQLTEFVQRTMAIALRNHGGKRLLMKDPKAVQFFDEIATLFPGVKFLHIVRDPRGVVASHRKRWPNDPLSRIVRAWKESIQHGALWAAANTNQYLRVKYEDLLHDFQPTLVKVCSYLDLPFHSDLLEFSQPVGYKGTKQGVDSEVIEKWREVLSPADVRYIERRCRRVTDELGYESAGSTISVGSQLRFVGHELILKYRETVRLNSGRIAKRLGTTNE